MWAILFFIKVLTILLFEIILFLYNELHLEQNPSAPFYVV